MERHLTAVVVGGGFGGMQAAQSLAQLGLQTTLLDRNNYNTFVPLLYQVAAAQLEPEKIAYPLRTLVRGTKNLQFHMADVRHVDFMQQQLETNHGVISYDFLVLATGSQAQFLGVPGAEQYSLPLRNLDDAIMMRNHILHCFEQASREPDPQRRQQLLTVVIVGGGPTGVELAGTLIELKRSLLRDYPTLDMAQTKVILLQSGDRLLRELPPALGRYTARKLLQLGVELRLHTRVAQVSPEGVYLEPGQGTDHQSGCELGHEWGHDSSDGDSHFLSAATVLWTAGLEAARPDISKDLTTAKKGKLVVQPTLQLNEHSNVYVIGDLAHMEDADGKPLSGVAPEALQQGVAVARNIKRQVNCQVPKPFRYFNKGRLAIIGGYAGVGQIGPLLLTGVLPWLLWLGVHLVYLPGFRSRLLVLLSWLHSYILRDRPVRLILHPRSGGQRQPVESPAPKP